MYRAKKNVTAQHHFEVSETRELVLTSEFKPDFQRLFISGVRLPKACQGGSSDDPHKMRTAKCHKLSKLGFLAGDTLIDTA